MPSPSFAPLSISTAGSQDEDEFRQSTRHQQQQQQQQQPAQQPTVMIDGQERPGYWKDTYRGGFSTSVCGLFQDPYDRSSCCAITCCGTFLQDRNTYLLTGERPPAWWARLVLYVGGFLVSILVGAFIPLAPLFFILGMCIRASFLRQNIRLQVQEKIHLARQQGGDNITTTTTTEDYRSMRGEHWCCVCVSNDKRRVLVVVNDDLEQYERDLQEQMERNRRQKADFCFRLWRCISLACCDTICFSWWQWCGMCATGQEDRELKRLLPPHAFLRDYVTFQPFGDYYPQIEWVRADAATSFWKHLGALSELSRKLMTLLQSAILLLLVAAGFHLFNNFRMSKVIVIGATLAQAFLILYVVYWRMHRLDISLDAVIKLFASGFVLAMTVALMVELILEVIGTFIYTLALEEEFLADHPSLDAADDDWVTKFNDSHTMKALAKKHFPTLMAYLFFQTVIVAALVEEVTKYYCFWMVEHPDFIFGGGGGTNDSNEECNALHLEEQGEEAAFTNGGPGSSPQQQQQPSQQQNPSTPSVPNYSPDRTTTDAATAPPQSPADAATSNLPPFRPRATPSHSTAGAMITVGMVATAVGFSCSENLMYVLGQGTFEQEILVLLIRSILPVHSLCAAIQSIGVVRRDVERDAEYQIGWALFPAILLHGLFDFALMTISYWQYINSPDPPKGPDGQDIIQDTSFKEQFPGLVVGSIIAGAGVFYYVAEAKKQRGRLSALEMTSNPIPSTVGLFV